MSQHCLPTQNNNVHGVDSITEHYADHLRKYCDTIVRMSRKQQEKIKAR